MRLSSLHRRPSPSGVAAVSQRQGVAVLPGLPGLLCCHLGTHSQVRAWTSSPSTLPVLPAGNLRPAVPQAGSFCTWQLPPGGQLGYAWRAGLETAAGAAKVIGVHICPVTCTSWGLPACLLPCPCSYPVELPTQAVEGLQLTLPADVGLVQGEELAVVLLCQEAAWLVASNLGRRVCEACTGHCTSPVGGPHSVHARRVGDWTPDHSPLCCPRLPAPSPFPAWDPTPRDMLEAGRPPYRRDRSRHGDLSAPVTWRMPPPTSGRGPR